MGCGQRHDGQSTSQNESDLSMLSSSGISSVESSLSELMVRTRIIRLIQFNLTSNFSFTAKLKHVWK